MRRILVVDDNPDDIEITRIALEEKGWDVQVEAYRQAEQALAGLRESEDSPALVLLDLNIPGMGGIECLRQIRADRRLQSVPVVMVTASSFEADEKRAYEAGANFFLFKDFDIDRYVENLDAVLKRTMV
ncbi:MAG: response regulator [Deltaproteobacteria bacterium]|nr:response regulator [Deltaproteobacteria bacterium]